MPRTPKQVKLDDVTDALLLAQMVNVECDIIDQKLQITPKGITYYPTYQEAVPHIAEVYQQAGWVVEVKKGNGLFFTSDGITIRSPDAPEEKKSWLSRLFQ